jgi:NADH-quinone oxidoreductase subunit E
MNAVGQDKDVEGGRAATAQQVSNAQPIPNQLAEQPDFSIPADLEAELDEIISHYPVKRSASLMLLHAVQERYRFVSRQAVEWIARKLELSFINVYELVTFYPMFTRTATGRYHLRICRTLSCALGGSHKIYESLCAKLGLDPHSHAPQTTPDGRFTVEFVECLASCGTAPVMMCNEKFHEGMTEERAAAILGECK